MVVKRINNFASWQFEFRICASVLIEQESRWMFSFLPFNEQYVTSLASASFCFTQLALVSLQSLHSIVLLPFLSILLLTFFFLLPSPNEFLLCSGSLESVIASFPLPSRLSVAFTSSDLPSPGQ